VGQFSYLSSFQITRLLYSQNSLKFVQHHLKELYQAGYLNRLFLPTITARGSALAVYTLDQKDYAYLKAVGQEPAGRFRASEQSEREWLFLKHTLAANDLLVLSHQLARQDQSVQLARFYTEHQLKQSPASVQMGKERVRVVLDGWVDLRKYWPGQTRQAQHCLAFELDRATTGFKSFSTKIRTRVAYLNGPYQRQFGTQSSTITFVTLGGERRLSELLAWTQDTLAAINAQQSGFYFLFAAFDPAVINAQEAFYSPIFRQPFSTAAVPLLEEP
jgi:hypothetical protein